MSFAIIISEKGGAERRELFEKGDVTVGRVQGNDLMLPKGNVSKRHAKLVFLNGRFIVSDLKSTNGTYVNGRKIAAATIVREGDKIYVGDFVLRFEAAPGVVLAAESTAAAPGPREATAAELGQPSSSPGVAAPLREGISHYPLENDPDEISGLSPRVVVPGPPRLPTGFQKGPGGTQMINSPAPGPSTDTGNPVIHATAHAVVASMQPAPAGSQIGAATRPGGAPSIPAAPPVPSVPPSPAGPSISAVAGAPVSVGSGPSISAPPGGIPGTAILPLGGSASPSSSAVFPSRTSRPPASPAQPPSTQNPHRAALSALVDRIGELIDLEALRDGTLPIEASLSLRVERAVREQASLLRQEGEIPESIDVSALARDAQREILGFGPLGPLLDDEDVASIQVLRHDHILALRGSSPTVVEPPFSSDEALRRAVARLCFQAGQPLGANELIVDRRLPRGQLAAVLAPLSVQGHTLTLRKPRRAESSPEDLVRSGVVSRGIWNTLAQCLGARLNMLVVAPPGPGLSSLLGALAGLAATGDERLAALQGVDQAFPVSSGAAVFSTETQQGDALIRALGRLAVDRVVVGEMQGATGAALLDAICGRSLSAVAAIQAPSLALGLSRAIPDLCVARPGLTPEVARAWLASSFELVIELARLADGRHRVLRVAETVGVEGGQIALRDLFVFQPDRGAPPGSTEGSFASTGVVPAFVDALRARGVPFDTSAFERTSSR
jgi:pilus assembly protein CpaF